MSRTTGEALREAMAVALCVHHENDCHDDRAMAEYRGDITVVAAAMVKKLGITREHLETLQGWAHSGMVDRGVGDPDWAACDRACNALTALLDAAEVQK